MGVEMYRNTFNCGSQTVAPIFDERGGMAVVFGNIFNDPGGIMWFRAREEYGDCLSPIVNPLQTQPQHVSGSYYWENREDDSTIIDCEISTTQNCCNTADAWAPDTAYGYQYCNSFDGVRCYCQKPAVGSAACTSGGAGTEPDWAGEATTCGDYILTDNDCDWLDMGAYDAPIVANSELWNWNDVFTPGADTTLTTGVAVGTKAQMDMITTCTDGTAYWATDRGDWNKTCGGGEQGTLYKCESNTWVKYYEPYEYPHPLRGEVCGTAYGISFN